MDVFGKNRKLEEVILGGLDYALYSRHDIPEMFMPFMMVYKDGQKKLIRLVFDGDPNEAFMETLAKSEEEYDQVVLCFEGRIPYENAKRDAVIVKGFDTSQPTGLTFVQAFEGIESGSKFQKLGRLSLVSKSDPLPVKLIARTTNKEVEDPYVSGIVIKDDHGTTSRHIIAGHENVSTLSNYMYQAVMNAINKNESDFSGDFTFKFVPGTLSDSGFHRFVIEQLSEELYRDPAVKSWESKYSRKVSISYKFDTSEVVSLARGQSNAKVDSIVETIKPMQEDSQETDKGNAVMEATKLANDPPSRSSVKPDLQATKPWWKFW